MHPVDHHLVISETIQLFGKIDLKDFCVLV
jgi:hypothetical protein